MALIKRNTNQKSCTGNTPRWQYTRSGQSCRLLHSFSSMNLLYTQSFFTGLWVLLLLVVIPKIEAEQKRALVFGGNGFIGSEVVLKLLEAGYHVTTVNRGNWYWDSPLRVKPRVNHHITCDRSDGVRLCWSLPEYLLKSGFIDVVVDMSAYDGQVVSNALDLLKGKVGLYVFISTDSIYQVCKKTERQSQRREEDAIRPLSEAERQRLAALEDYGHRKLTAEEVLVKQAKGPDAVPYVILRLPDVLGQRDTTERLWQYQMWLQYYNIIGIPIIIPEKYDGLQTSYIYVHDAVSAVLKVLQLNTTIHNQIYNLAFEEPKTLKELIYLMAEIIGIQVDFRVDKEPKAFQTLPSVSFGSMSIAKAQKDLGWSPTPWKTALKEIIDFHLEAMGRFPLQRDSVARKLLFQLIPEDSRLAFATALTDDVRKIEATLKEKDEL